MGNAIDSSISIDQSSSGEATRKGRYWRAHGMAELALSEFQHALTEADQQGQRRAFFLLASYYSRTVRILRSALDERKEALAQAALENLITLHHPLLQMYRASPDEVPMPMVVDRLTRDRIVRDLIIRALSETPEPVAVDLLVDRVNDLDVMGTIGPTTIRRHLQDMVASGHVRQDNSLYSRTERVYSEHNLDALSLRALVGDEYFDKLESLGFKGLTDVDSRSAEFRSRFLDQFGFSLVTADSFIQAVETLLEAQLELPVSSAWRHADLIGSSIPRPYQYGAYAVFRGGGYQGQVIESPTGSGKTMIGMLCIQDWLRTMTAGESILVVVPTSSYQQQWVGELCYKSIGLRLSPEHVFSGTPGDLERHQRQTGARPAVLLVTYTALAQIGSGIGKGGFDINSIETFLQSANVQYVILDEVHKTVENMSSVSANVTRLLVRWLRDASIRGLIGFSGTAVAFRDRFEKLDLVLAYSVDNIELIRFGFVAPFAEFGVPFSDSTRERHIRTLLDTYKNLLRSYFKNLGGSQLREWFAAIPLEERVAIGQNLLGMYRGRADALTRLSRRMSEWEHGGELKLTERSLVSIIQVANGWSDEDLARRATVPRDAFGQLSQELDAVRTGLSGLIQLPRSLSRLEARGFGTRLDAEGLKQLRVGRRSVQERVDNAKELLSTTFTGLYWELSDWYFRVGEGRVEMIKALIEVERSIRPVSGVIVFDSARRIEWKDDIEKTGFDGVGGLFAHLLGEPGINVLAAISSELYITHNPTDPLPPRIANYISDTILRGEMAEAIVNMAMRGAEIPEEAYRQLRQRFHSRLKSYISRLMGVKYPRPGDFSRRVLGPVRRLVQKLDLGDAGERLRARMTLRNVHLANLIITFFDYAALAENFRAAHVAELEQASGTRQKFFVVSMPAGRRKQLMYSLVAAIVDAEELELDIVIVSSWARTGWNVLRPNVLIDATATRDVTAWQQLRGRAMRSLPTWSNDASRLLQILLNRPDLELEEEYLPEDLLDGFADALAAGHSADVLDEPLRRLLSKLATRSIYAKIQEDGLEALSEEERMKLAVRVMMKRNKVTHIYELVKAYGSTSQVSYDRQKSIWGRRDSIAIKHIHNEAVNALTGEMLRGEDHAPLLYATDPRKDLPSEIADTVGENVRGRDKKIVRGWLA